VGDTTITVERIFFATDPDSSCDTLITLNVTIIDTGKLVIKFDQDDFCKGDDMKGKIELEEPNFTAFDWKYFSRENQVQPDSTWIGLTEPYLDITEPGFYYVYAYMDTSLYDTLDYLRIVATTCAKTKDTIVEDCKLVIPNVFTPNGDKDNEVFGIKKLNLKRENELIIHDRWGKEVFRQKNYQCVYKSDGFHNTEKAFDGHSRGGQKLPDGTYYYAFKYDAFPKKKAKTYTGVVVILRD
jgi:gliding motility-associated-like protein